MKGVIGKEGRSVPYSIYIPRKVFIWYKENFLESGYRSVTAYFNAVIREEYIKKKALPLPRPDKKV